MAAEALSVVMKELIEQGERNRREHALNRREHALNRREHALNRRAYREGMELCARVIDRNAAAMDRVYARCARRSAPRRARSSR